MATYNYSVNYGRTKLIVEGSLDVALRTLVVYVERWQFPHADPLCTLNVNVCVWTPSESLAAVVELAPIEPQCNGPEHEWVGNSAERLGYTMKRTCTCIWCGLRRHMYTFRASPEPNYVRYEVRA